jgi:hypothetical protein
MELSEVVQRAWRDDAFKRRLLAAPRATLEVALGVTLPAGLSIYIHEQTSTDLHLVLPVPPEDPGAAGETG